MVERVGIPALVSPPPKKAKCDVCFEEFPIYELTAWKLTKLRDIAVCDGCKAKLQLGKEDEK